MKLLQVVPPEDVVEHKHVVDEVVEENDEAVPVVAVDEVVQPEADTRMKMVP
jgi:hypothetical protein